MPDHGDAVEILLVGGPPQESELVVQALRQRNLTDRVLVIGNSAEAMDYLFARGRYLTRKAGAAPKVVLLGRGALEGGGLPALRELRRQDPARAIPVVILASSAKDPEVEAAYALGANSYVVMPSDPQAYQDAVERLGSYWLLVNRVPA